MKINRKNSQRGNSILEFALVCVPFLIALVGVIDLARGIWLYHTLANAVKTGARYAIVHGKTCADLSPSCAVSVAAVVQTVQKSGVGLDPAQLSLTLTSTSGDQICAPASSCGARAELWPAASEGQTGQTIMISGAYPFRAVLGMFWPGGAPAFDLYASSQGTIQF